MNSLRASLTTLVFTSLALVGAVACGGKVDDGPGDVSAAQTEGQAGRDGGGSEGERLPSNPGGSGDLACAAPIGVEITTATKGGGETPPSECPCTRRVPGGEAFQCPVGVGQSVTATIGPDGGTITLVGQQGKASGVPFTLEIPPGALAPNVAITVTETDLAPPSALTDYSPVYKIEPASLELAVSAKVTIPWSNAQTWVGGELAMYWSGGCAPGTFARVGDSYVNAGFQQGSTKKLGWAVVGHPRSSASTCN